MSAACGTRSGYQRHLKVGTVACGPCLTEEAAHNKAWRIRSDRTKTVPLSVAFTALMLAGPSGPQLRRELGDVVADAILYRASRTEAA